MSQQKAFTLKFPHGGHPAGTLVFDNKGHDYGCANADTRVTGFDHSSVTLKRDGDYPFFTVPTHYLADHVMCEVPPEGWWCSRPAGHEGPCAARSIDELSASPTPVAAAGPPESTVETLQAEVARLEGLVYVPGLWRCAKCEFQLVQKNLNANTGTVTARDQPGDKCPNCASPLWRVTERDDNTSNYAAAERLQLEVVRLNKLLITPSLDQQNQAWLAVWEALVDEVPDFIKSKGATPPIAVAVEAVRMMSDLTGRYHAALLWLIYNHQGSSSPVGRPARYAIGIGNFERLSALQIQQAEQFRDAFQSETTGGH